MKKLIVTIPAKDEAESLGGVINDIHTQLKNLPYTWEIIVVDDGSTDQTSSICRTMNINFVQHPRTLGLAGTFRTEMKECLRRGANIIAHIDADGQYNASELVKLLNKFDEGYDLVLGSRFAGKIEQMPFIKKWGNKAFSVIISGIIKQKITDAQTGLRVFSRQVAEEVLIRSSHTYTQEQLIRAARQNFRIAEVPVFFRKRQYGKSKLIKNPFEYAVKAWINIFRIYRDFEPLKFFGLIGLFIMLLSAPLIARLAYFYFTTGMGDHIFSMVLILIFILSGLQIILFGFLADMRTE